MYGHYEKTFTHWQEAGIRLPPVFIVVCNNTATSKLVYDYISGFHRLGEDGETEAYHEGRLASFRNFDEHGNRLSRPRTLLIDSEQLESGDALDKDFHDMAADEIERFRREIVERSGNLADGENISDQELLREVMNTVGKEGRLRRIGALCRFRFHAYGRLGCQYCNPCVRCACFWHATVV